MTCLFLCSFGAVVPHLRRYTSASGSHFPYLHGHAAWRKVADEAGLVLQHYENLDAHMAQGYRDLATGADLNGFKTKDGLRPMSDDYNKAVELIETQRMGMNLAVLTVQPDALQSSL